MCLIYRDATSCSCGLEEVRDRLIRSYVMSFSRRAQGVRRCMFTDNVNSQIMTHHSMTMRPFRGVCSPDAALHCEDTVYSYMPHTVDAHTFDTCWLECLRTTTHKPMMSCQDGTFPPEPRAVIGRLCASFYWPVSGCPSPVTRRLPVCLHCLPRLISVTHFSSVSRSPNRRVECVYNDPVT